MRVTPVPTSVDVLLLLEGTYPYVRGGVSSWINRLLTGFPDVRFGIIFLGSARKDYGSPAYAMASNVVHYEEHFLYESTAPDSVRARTGSERIDVKTIRSVHDSFHMHTETARQSLDILADNFGVSHKDFVSAREIWELFLERYAAITDKPAFIDYFWALRGMHGPLWVLRSISARAPMASIYHSASTGYAGYLGALLGQRNRSRLILSEHGIYTKERRIDLMLASWVGVRKAALLPSEGPSHLRRMWIHFFETLARVAYGRANDIVNLYAGAGAAQCGDGADPARIRTIPNGIPVRRFAGVRCAYEDKRNVIALIGRVVRIKDIKTFIRGVHLLAQRDRRLEAWIVGPEDEDPEYCAECRALVRHMSLERCVKILGHQSVTNILRVVRLSVLSSISEGLPLTVLESFAAGVPVVATDVGACRELIYGRAPADVARGPAGSIAPIASPAALAREIEGIIYQPQRWKALSEAAVLRVENHYQEEQMFAAYRQLYDSGRSSR